MTDDLKQKETEAWARPIAKALAEALAPVLERVARLEEENAPMTVEALADGVQAVLATLKQREADGPAVTPTPCATCGGARWVCDVTGKTAPCVSLSHFYVFHANRRLCPDCSKPAASTEGTLQHNPGLGSVTMSTEQAAALLKNPSPAESKGKPDWADWMATNEYHQSLGAKWMCEAIVSKYAPDEREFVHAFARKWEDASFWRPKTEPAEYVRADLLEAAEAKLDHSQRKYRASCRHIEELAREDEEKRARIASAERRITELEGANAAMQVDLADFTNAAFANGRAEGREAGVREAAEVTREELATMRSWLMTWGPLGQPNWCDPKGLSVPVAKVSLERLLDAAQRGVEGFEQDSISHSEQHGEPHDPAR